MARRGSLLRNNHELLHSETATGVGTKAGELVRRQMGQNGMNQSCLPSVEDVHEGDGENVRLLGSGKVGDVDVERNALYRC
jgi:hypothetical protein